jgi:hypothetical protein
MSSGEAEYYAMVKAAAEGLGIKALCKDLGYDVKLVIAVDSGAAKTIVSRLGLGKVRHMEVRYLWAKEAHKRGRFAIREVWGLVNTADVLSNPMTCTDMKDNLERVGAESAVRAIHLKPSQAVGRDRWADVDDFSDQGLTAKTKWNEVEDSELENRALFGASAAVL